MGDEGRNVKLFLIWSALMRQLCPFIILHENVTGFGTGSLNEVLGDLYVVCPSASCASLMGYPIRRKRQMCILVLKSWLYPQLRAAGMQSNCNPHDVRNLVGLQSTLDALSLRPCHLSWKDFIVATADDIEAELAEARGRPGVTARWDAVAAGHTTVKDKTGKECRVFAEDHGCPTLAALLPMERERIESVLWQEHPGADVVDVSQNPTKRARTIKRDETTFMTVIAGGSYFVRTDVTRQDFMATTLVAASDILSMSEFPITAEQVRHAGGAPCMFSTCRTAPQARTARSMKKQVGNAMHFTHVGLILLSALVKFPNLGVATAQHPTTASTSSSSTAPRKREPDTRMSGGSGLLRAVRARRNR